MEVITSKKCTLCLEVLPMSAYRFMTTRMIYAARCRHCEADQNRERERKRRKAAQRGACERIWADDEVEVVLAKYAEGGTAACLPLLPGRTRSQVQNKAQMLGIRYVGPTVSGGNSKHVEPLWVVPAHDYCEADYALRNMPALSDWRPAGSFVPNVGLVMGV